MESMEPTEEQTQQDTAAQDDAAAPNVDTSDPSEDYRVDDPSTGDGVGDAVQDSQPVSVTPGQPLLVSEQSPLNPSEDPPATRPEVEEQEQSESEYPETDQS